ncbi:MAG: hypothetical protein ACRD63_06155, partial [Pyrinomonadaceae bacterium]
MRRNLWFWFASIGIATFTAGYFIGHFARPTQAPLIIERSSPPPSTNSLTQSVSNSQPIDIGSVSSNSE